MPSTTRRPATADHLDAEAGPFKFTGADGKKHELPPAADAVKRLPGRALRDAALGGETGQMTYLFKMVEASEPKKGVLDALYDLPQDAMLKILNDWGEAAKAVGEPSVGESSRSSD